MTGPLGGVNVLDLGTGGVGPWAAVLLGYLGANVVKVESPAGDRSLHQPPMKQGLSTTYTKNNLNKVTSILNLKDPAMEGVRRRLVSQADVAMDNLRPGVVARLGFGFEEMKKLNPYIVSASSPAWGEEGPMIAVPGLDFQVQMLSGYASLNGRPGDELELVRYPQLDNNASCFLAATIVLGLIYRERSGQGQRVTASHLGSAIALQVTRLGEYFATGEPAQPMGSGCGATVPHQAFLCRDNQWLLVGVETEAQWRSFCEAMERSGLAEDARYATNRLRVQNRNELVADLEGTFARHPARWWACRLEGAGVPFSYLYDFEGLRYHQQVLENDYMPQIDVPHQGRLFWGGIPWDFSESPAAIEWAHAPGQDTQRVIAEGFGHDGALPRASLSDGAEPHSPLEGIRVLDASQGYCGPFATLLLAEAGAEVIKVEPPGGDYARGFAPALDSGDSAAFTSLNRNKRSIVLNLDDEPDQRAFRALAATSQIIVEDWGPGVAEARGLGYKELALQNPNLVYCALSSFGEKGPLSSLPSTELTLQGWGEYWKNLGTLGAPPQRVGADIVTLGTGLMAFLGILAATYYRLRTGKGQRLAVSMLGTVMCMKTAQWAAVTGPDVWQSKLYLDNDTSEPWHGYRTQDRPMYFNVNNSTEEQYIHLLTELGMLEEVIGDERFGNGGRDAAGAGQYSAEVTPIWEKYFQERPFKEVAALINENGGAAVEMLWHHELFQHPQVALLNLLAKDGQGNSYIRAPWRGQWADVPIVPPPACGEHNQELLAVQSTA